jgi:hypothetical protein
MPDYRPLPPRLEGDLPRRVRIIGTDRVGKVDLIYYDRLHTGDSYDELQVSMDDGTCVRGRLDLFEEEVPDA